MKVFAVSIGQKYQYCEQYLKTKVPNITFLKEGKENFLFQWNKLHFFKMDLNEPVCVIDLDILLINEYEKLLNYPIEKGEFLSIRSWWEDGGACELNGGFYKFFPTDTHYIYDEFKKNKKYWENYFIEKGLKPGPINGEENFVEHMVRQKLNLKFVPDTWVTRMIGEPNKDWLSKINLKYPGSYMYLGDRFNPDIKLVHYTKDTNKPPQKFLEL
jgi:hypothetical protein